MQKIREKVCFLPGIFYDETKQTMISVEICGGEDQKKITEEKKMLHIYEQWIRTEILPLSVEITIDPSIISVDIQSRHISKRIAGVHILDFLEKKHMQADIFIMFSDSLADAVLCDELVRHHKSVRFFYVGKEPIKKYSFPVIKAKEAFYDKAVVAFLKQGILSD